MSCLSQNRFSPQSFPPLAKNGRWTFKLFSFWNRRVLWSKKIPLVTHTKINDSANILFKMKFSSQNDAIYNLNKGTIGKWYLERNYLKSVWVKISVDLNRFRCHGLEESISLTALQSQQWPIKTLRNNFRRERKVSIQYYWNVLLYETLFENISGIEFLC